MHESFSILTFNAPIDVRALRAMAVKCFNEGSHVARWILFNVHVLPIEDAYGIQMQCFYFISEGIGRNYSLA